MIKKVFISFFLIFSCFLFTFAPISVNADTVGNINNLTSNYSWYRENSCEDGSISISGPLAGGLSGDTSHLAEIFANAKSEGKSYYCQVVHYVYKEKNYTQYYVIVFDSSLELSGSNLLVVKDNFLFSSNYHLDFIMSLGSDYTNVTSSGSYYYNTGGSDLGDNLSADDIPLTCADLDIGQFKFSVPNNNTKLGGAFPELLQNIDYVLYGKLPFEFEKTGIGGFAYNSVARNEYVQTLFDDLYFTFGDEKLHSAMAKPVVYGTCDDWAKNGYVCFKITGTIQFPSDVVRVNERVRLQAFARYISKIKTTYWNDNYYSDIKSSAVFITCEYYIDTDGDGLDDSSGLAIPENGIIDNNGDGNWDDVQGSDGGSSSSSNSDLSDEDTVLGYLKSFFKSINEFFKLIGDTLSTVSKTVLQIPDYIGNILSVFPEPIPKLAVTAIAIIIFISVLKAIRG